jgi:hypothetical protein
MIVPFLYYYSNRPKSKFTTIALSVFVRLSKPYYLHLIKGSDVIFFFFFFFLTAEENIWLLQIHYD